MKLLDYIPTKATDGGAGYKESAALFDVSVPFVWQIAHGTRFPSVLLALKIELVTRGRVTLADLLPEVAAQMRKCGYVKVKKWKQPPQ